MTIKGVYLTVTNNSTIPSTSYFENLQSLGCTDLFLVLISGGYGEVYNTYKIAVQNWLNAVNGTLKVHVLQDNRGQFNLTDLPTYIQNNSQLVGDCPELEGISFNDFVPLSPYYNSGVDQSSDLISWATGVCDAVHDVDSSKKVSAALYPNNTNWSRVEDLSPIFDYVIPMLYRSFPSETNTWVSSKLLSNISKANGNILPAFITYPLVGMDASDFTLDKIKLDVFTALNNNTLGYILWKWNSVPDGMYFPDWKVQMVGNHLIKNIV